MSIDSEAESPLTPLGTQFVAPDSLQKQLSQPLVVFAGEAPAWQFLCWLIAPFVIVNFAIGPLSYWVEGPGSGDSNVFKIIIGTVFAVCLGTLPVQFVILNCYVVFSIERWWLRLAVLLGTALLLCVAGLAGFGVLYYFGDWTIGRQEIENGLEFPSLLPTFVLASQLPFWFMRAFFGWQLERVQTESAESDSDNNDVAAGQRLSILHLLVATAIVAASLGLIRMSPSTIDNDAERWAAIGFVSAIAFCFSLISLVLLLLFARINSRFLYWALVVGVPILFVVTGYVVLAFFIWDMYWDEMEEINFNTLIFSTIGLTFIVGLSICLWLLRAHGWIIRSVRKKTPSGA
jgi:hypothetical protein